MAINSDCAESASAQAQGSPARPLVSFVTPFYNTRQYLAECIESVLRQNYPNWEYILVDNCSTDGSSEVAAHYAAQFPENIRLTRTQRFLSQVQNYNFALSQVSPNSKYCKVVQADDLIFADCIRSMVELAEANPTVGIVSAYELEGDDVRLGGLRYPSTILSGRNVGRLYFLKGMYLFGTPTSLLIRSDLIRARSPFYDERYAPFEDGHACLDLLLDCDFGFVHQVLTYSRRDNGGIISGVRAFGLECFLQLSMLVVHGRDYLSVEEYKRCLNRAEQRYFTHIAKAVCALHRETREFWEFHRAGLRSINYSLGWIRVAGRIPRALAEKTWSAFWAWRDGNSPAPEQRREGAEIAARASDLRPERH